MVVAFASDSSTIFPSGGDKGGIRAEIEAPFYNWVPAAAELRQAERQAFDSQ
jgi:hypothetical protein